MQTLTLADIEADLTDALEQGADAATLDRLGELMDRLEEKPSATLHASALWYATQGVHVFPLTPGTKIPFKGSGGFLDATTDPTMIDNWWTGNPRANIGIATGHLVDVIDIDGPEGVATWAAMYDEMPPTFGRVSTPRPGGIHLYVPATPGRQNRAKILPGIDYRGEGGYVVAPPSVITVGPHPGTYTWYMPLEVAA